MLYLISGHDAFMIIWSKVAGSAKRFFLVDVHEKGMFVNRYLAYPGLLISIPLNDNGAYCDILQVDKSGPA